MIKQLKLHNTNQVALLDEEDYDRVIALGLRWLLKEKHVRAETFTVNQFTHKRIKGYLLLHRFVMRLDRNSDIQIDHKDRDVLNNTKDNLRLCSRSQNMMNRTSKTGMSGYKGVTWHIRVKMWHAKIGVNKQRISLGYFSDVKDAAKAYNEAAAKYHGPFALLNKI